MKKILLFIALFLFVSCEEDKEDPITIVGNWDYNKVIYWNALPCYTGDSTVVINDNTDYGILSFNDDNNFSISNYIYSGDNYGNSATVEGTYSNENGQLCIIDATMDAGSTVGGWNEGRCYTYELNADTLIWIVDSETSFNHIHWESLGASDSSCQYWYFVRQ